MQFHEITAEDAQWARPKLEGAGFNSCEFNFGTVFMWSEAYGTEIAEEDGYVVVRNLGHTHAHYLYPLGGDNLKGILEVCIRDAESLGREPMFYSIPESEVAKIEAEMPGAFIFNESENVRDYIYSSEDLQNLAGRKYQKKRNHVSRFCKEHPEYRFEPINPKNLAEIRSFDNVWYHGDAHSEDEGLRIEHAAIERVFDHYFELGLVGGLIRIDCGIVAFCFGGPVNSEVLDTQVEKARYDIDGCYAVINREFARYFGKDYKYINREEDLGEPGLRKAKESYFPVIMEKRYTAVLNK